MKLIPKTFGPLTVGNDGASAIQFVTQAGCQARIGPKPDATDLSPTDLILASLGACLSISMQMACQEMSLDTGATQIVLKATKALDAPGRIERFDVTVTMGNVLDTQHCERLFARTKELCTISHTLNAHVELSLIA